jgi:hypothetical protein
MGVRASIRSIRHRRLRLASRGTARREPSPNRA